MLFFLSWISRKVPTIKDGTHLYFSEFTDLKRHLTPLIVQNCVKLIYSVKREQFITELSLTES